MTKQMQFPFQIIISSNALLTFHMVQWITYFNTLLSWTLKAADTTYPISDGFMAHGTLLQCIL